MSIAPLIHVVDDDESLHTALRQLLGAAGCEARGYTSAGDFLLQPPPNRPGYATCPTDSGRSRGCDRAGRCPLGQTPLPIQPIVLLPRWRDDSQCDPPVGQPASRYGEPPWWPDDGGSDWSLRLRLQLPVAQIVTDNAAL
jgi:hypothetical protein